MTPEGFLAWEEASNKETLLQLLQTDACRLQIGIQI
jgi:hypothetical protein